MTNEQGDAVAAETDAQRCLREAQAALAQAEAQVAARETAAEALASLLASVRAEFDRLEALDEVTEAQLHTEAVLRRKVRRLEGELQQARDAANEAEESTATAERGVRAARLATLDEHLRDLDAEHIADAKASRARFTKQRAAVFAVLLEAHLLDVSLQPQEAQVSWGARGTLAGLIPEGTDALAAASEALNRLAAIASACAAGDGSSAYTRLLADAGSQDGFTDRN